MPAALEIIERLQELAKDAGCRLTPAPEETQKWLTENASLPSELVSILCHSWPNDDLCIGVYDLWSLGHLSESERSKIAFAAGFFMIGGAGNGDLLVVPCRSDEIDGCEVGLISHEELWDRRSELQSIFRPICRGFLTLLKDAAIEGKLPLDFYDAHKDNSDANC